MAYVSPQLRQQVIERAKGRCEYCQTQQVIVVSMEIDHVIPESAGGKTQLDNLCLACVGCNSFKYDFVVGIDPETNEEVMLYNPRTQQWSEHFLWSNDGIRLNGRTAIGRATIERLKMNRDIVVDARRRWVEADWHPPKIEE